MTSCKPHCPPPPLPSSFVFDALLFLFFLYMLILGLAASLISVPANISLLVKVGRSDVLCGVNSLIEGWQLETSLA